jgi:acetyl esterase
MASPLHPDALALLELARAANRPRYETLEPEAGRAQMRAGRAALQPPMPPLSEVRNLALPSGVRLRLYRPAEGTLPCLVFAHGGGWVIGDLDTHDHLAATLAAESGCAVLAVDYRLAPEAPFPAAVEDFAEGVRYAHAQAAALGIDPARLAVGGDSAGGNLSAVAAIMARDGALPALRHQSLLYPAVDMSQSHDSIRRFEAGLPLTRATMEYFRGHYAPDPTAWADWRCSPLRAASLAGVAPAFVLTVGHDPLVDEGREYAARLEREGVRVTYMHAADTLHGALTMVGVVKSAALLISAAARALKDDMR